MKERFLPGVLAGAVAVGGIGLAVEGVTESQSDIDARQDAEIMATYREAVNAERTAVMLYISLTGQQSRPLSLEEYRLLFDTMVEDIQDGQDPMATGFGNAEPTEQPIYEGGEK